MKSLVIAEHESGTVRRGSLSALGFAQQVLTETGAASSDAGLLVLGDGLAAVTGDARKYAPVLVADAAALARPAADTYASVIAQVARTTGVELIVAASTTFSKDVVSRAAGLLGGAMASDVVGHEVAGGELILVRPMFAGSITARVKLRGEPRVVTVRATSYEPAEPIPEPGDVTAVDVDSSGLPHAIEVEAVESTARDRPDLTEARVVVSGGRAFKSTEDFESHVGALADALGGAAGSSRALVDAGITPNELQVGQTGKVVAPELYIALGLSGAVQHLAGMKNSKVIVAVNKDPDAPIFEVADYGLVGDVYKVVPELIDKLKAEG